MNQWGPQNQGGGGFGPGGGGGGFPPGGGQPPGPGGPGAGGPFRGGVARESIPFLPEDHANITAMSRFMMAAGAIAMVNVLVSFVTAITSAIRFGFGNGISQIIGSLIGGAVSIALGATLIMGARSMAKIVTSDDADSIHLADGFKKLRIYFTVKGVLMIALLVLICCCAPTIGGLMAFLIRQ